VNNFSTQLQQLNDNFIQLNTTVNGLSNSINEIVDQYKPIAGFSYNNVQFTDFTGNYGTGSFHGAWYRPIKLQSSPVSDDGVDLKFMLLVIRAINANLVMNGNWFSSDQMTLPIEFVNNNDFRVFYASEIHTRQADYMISQNPINLYRLSIRPVESDNVVNDSA
jgi:hypothetical protein